MSEIQEESVPCTVPAQERTNHLEIEGEEKTHLSQPGANMYELEHEWTWYAHYFSSSNTYASSYVKLGTCNTIGGFWNYFNHISSTQLHQGMLYCNGYRITAFSLFKNNILPEWEREENKDGGEWGCREYMSEDVFANNWKELAMAAVGEILPNTTGIRMVNKSKVGRELYKLEVWMDTGRDVHAIKETKRVINKVVADRVNFTYMPHNEKFQQAFDYNKERLTESESKCSGDGSNKGKLSFTKPTRKGNIQNRRDMKNKNRNL